MNNQFTPGQLRTQAKYFEWDRPGKMTKSKWLRGIIRAVCDGSLIWKETPENSIGWGYDRIRFKRQRDGSFKSEDGTIRTAEELKQWRECTFERIKILKLTPSQLRFAKQHPELVALGHDRKIVKEGK